MIEAINKIAALASLPTETTYASSAVKINWARTSQTSRKNMIKEFIEYGDHLCYVNPNDGKLWLIDTLTGITPVVEINDFEVKSPYGNTQSKLVGKIVANTEVLEFDDGGVGVGTPSLKPLPIQLSTITDHDSQDEYAIKVVSQPTGLSGSDIVYTYTDMTNVLARKKSMYESQIIVLEYNGLLDIQLGQRVSFDNTYDTRRDSKVGVGAMTITGREYDNEKETTKLTGIGTFTA